MSTTSQTDPTNAARIRAALGISDRVQVALFDLGGVLTVDPWQAALLTPGAGLASILGVPTEQMAAAGAVLWPRFAGSHRPERRYWEELESILSMPIHDSARAAALDLVGPSDAAVAVLTQVRDAGLRVGVCAETTSFFYARQVSDTALVGLLDPALVYRSDKHARLCAAPDSLYDRVAWDLDPAGVVVVDDSATHLEAAADRGFETAHIAL